MNALIRQRLTASEFGTQLATFNGEPAIFYAKAPDDAAVDVLYPHAVFTVEKFSDAIHGVAGLLTVDVICTQETVQPETLEVKLRRALEGVFFSPVDAEIFMLKWQRTDIFNEPASERLPLIVGATSTFELREFPSAETVSPNPIQALNLWASRFDEELSVITTTRIPEIFMPTFDNPAIYFDAQRTRMLSQTSAVTMLEIVAIGHIFCAGVKNRRTWLSAIAHGIMNSRAIFLSDGSPLRLTGCEQIYNADDKKRLWDNRDAWAALNAVNGADVIFKCLTPAERAKIVTVVEELSGYDDNDVDIDEFIQKK